MPKCDDFSIYVRFHLKREGIEVMFENEVETFESNSVATLQVLT